MLDSGVIILEMVQFTSLKPYRIIVSGRIKHYIRFWRTRDREGSGMCLKEAMEGTNIRVNEFTVARK
jgi:hypothetical protein